jgi:hypothetical protein
MALFALLACLFVVAKKIKLPFLPKGSSAAVLAAAVLLLLLH